MATVNLRSFRQIVRNNKRRIKGYLTRLRNNPPRGLDTLKAEADKHAWAHTDCLDCANCCKTMSPTYTKKDVKRISAHLGMTDAAFREKWLYKDRTGDWMNVKQPCQFLDLETNMCNIYAVRPADCAGFPHHTKRKMVEYMHMYQQNIEYCPATYRLVEYIQEKLK
ncbi:YkgJ family cysteine cluster protein [Flavitalea sp. BT771]|uniref:YkgJ family cysteine cluster protein n=1 Tax=Flavitalea sp. BT771 TaxID=3063329 RepID=UPI0026E1D3C6|nr:YkgJ family cysteine cluster protein [Flavitalea sp. BT771]MDO6431003.1 YkgJ family cysteine cluster protein [Flavitalea sp. BT771]MDV6219910.1 YkgJ family cysteine cluster protein [Flavitalea sp. BT771]